MHSDPKTTGDAQRNFVADLAQARSEDAIFGALYRLSTALVPVRLWTVMTVDMEAGLARRAYSNMPEAYPTSGTKPVMQNDWFQIVHDRHEVFVANTLDEIADVFPDFELIGSLGCASVVNLPVVSGGPCWQRSTCWMAPGISHPSVWP
ncbi:GAF domain-containing protein [Rhodophyticola sp. CCM32]|uniref:GAF domain-containing protein n=1 Tax=Rhodophyticola sp. CCM32 TaxID=2916397 RepID=UPI0026BE3CB8